MIQQDWKRVGTVWDPAATTERYAAALPGYEWQGLHLVRKGTRNERIRNERLPLVVPTESKSSVALYVLIALIAPLAVGFLIWAALQ